MEDIITTEATEEDMEAVTETIIEEHKETLPCIDMFYLNSIISNSAPVSNHRVTVSENGFKHPRRSIPTDNFLKGQLP